MRAVTGDMSSGWDYRRLKEKHRRNGLLVTVIITVLAAVIFGGSGLYLTWKSYDPSLMVAGFALMVSAVICLFVGACAAIDLLPD